MVSTVILFICSQFLGTLIIMDITMTYDPFNVLFANQNCEKEINKDIWGGEVWLLYIDKNGEGTLKYFKSKFDLTNCIQKMCENFCEYW